MKTQFRIAAFCISIASLTIVGFAECEHGGGGGGGGGDIGQPIGQGYNRSSGSGASHASAAAAANYQALRQAGYYRDAKTGYWYYQPDLTKAAVRVATPSVVGKTSSLAAKHGR